MVARRFRPSESALACRESAIAYLRSVDSELARTAQKAFAESAHSKKLNADREWQARNASTPSKRSRSPPSDPSRVQPTAR